MPCAARGQRRADEGLDHARHPSALGRGALLQPPRVSDDNPYAEALFRTLKYRPEYPRRPFATVEQARQWVERFVAWYNGEHLHSSIRFVTPNDRHRGRDSALLAVRHALYQRARRRTPRRWSGQTRNWTPIGPVTLNPHTHEPQALTTT
ncbi:integrase core domain-containing protein [Sorangium sp. So ce1036]|uniref:integrase core domain-containing protein n=1 Tax=Sorangium sp. So ce1036 TaxID=3133328 RepID=UPI003F51C7A6